MIPNRFNLRTLAPQLSSEGGQRTLIGKQEWPVLQGMSLAQVTLTPGGTRVPHWHPNAHELAYCVKGQVVDLFVSPNRASHFTLHAGDVAFFPMGSLHSISNVSTEPADLLVAFNNEHVEDFTLGGVLETLPQEQLGIIWGENTPAHWNNDPFWQHKIAENYPEGGAYCLALHSLLPAIRTAGGWARLCTSNSLPQLEGLGLFDLGLMPDALREPHWHPNAHELNVVLSGHAEIVLQQPNGQQEVFDLTPGMASFLPRGYPHSIRNRSQEELHMTIFFSHAEPSDIGVSGSLGNLSASSREALSKGLYQGAETTGRFQVDQMILPVSKRQHVA